MKQERRTFEFNIETRDRNDGSLPQIVGHAALFNSLSEVLTDQYGDQFQEKIAPGAFSRALKKRNDVRALVEHDPNRMLARTKSGTMKVEEDDKGLRVVINPSNTSYARDLLAQIRAGDVSGFSFGFYVLDDEFDNSGDMPIRTLNEIDAFEVTVTGNPAYVETEKALNLRTLIEEHENRKHTDTDYEVELMRMKLDFSEFLEKY
jgi:HK97 family phage prohead protease